jgi:hypothetical protein
VPGLALHLATLIYFFPDYLKQTDISIFQDFAFGLYVYALPDPAGEIPWQLSESILLIVLFQ